MFKFLTIKHAVYALLLICVMSVNHIIIYNEELLVLLSFFLFVAFVARYFGNQIKESLEKSSEVIREICEISTNSKQQYQQQLSKEFEKSVKYKSVFRVFQAGTEKQLSNKTALTQSLRSHFHQQWLQKSTTLVESKLQLQPALLEVMANKQLDLVLTKWGKKQHSKDKVETKLLDSVIQAMSK